MNSEEALALLDGVCAQVKATREEHERLQRAREIVRDNTRQAALLKYLDGRIKELVEVGVAGAEQFSDDVKIAVLKEVKDWVEGGR